jgi:hypothetical protein
MRHLSFLFTLLLMGCSTHPVVNTLDFFKPGKMYPNDVDPYGGVLLQQGSVVGPSAGPGFADPPPTIPAVVPPPVPVPGIPAGAMPPPPAFPKQ